jgi:hypothetical protein
MKKPVIMEVDPDTILGHVLDPDNGYKVIHVGRGISPQLMDMVGKVKRTITIMDILSDGHTVMGCIQPTNIALAYLFLSLVGVRYESRE